MTANAKLCPLSSYHFIITISIVSLLSTRKAFYVKTLASVHYILSEYYVITKTGSTFDQCMNSRGGGGNTYFLTCTVDVDGADHLPRMEEKAVDRANREPYQLGRQAVTIFSFTVMSRLKNIILGRQPLYTVPAPSTAQVGILVPPHDEQTDFCIYLANICWFFKWQKIGNVAFLHQFY